MDPAGARALALRIAEEQARAEAAAQKAAQAAGKRTGEGAPPPPWHEQVTYVRPTPVRKPHDVRIYVRGPDGQLRRANFDARA